MVLRPEADDVGCVAFSPDGRYVGLAGGGAVEIWDVTTGRLVQTLRGHEEDVYSVAFSPDNRRVASAGWDKTIRIWDARTGEGLRTLHGPAWPVRTVPLHFSSLVFSPDGRRLVSVRGKALTVWDVSNGQELLTLDAQGQEFTAVVFSPDGGRIASASWDGAVQIWSGAPPGARLNGRQEEPAAK
jgi:WD40 repeat protein